MKPLNSLRMSFGVALLFVVALLLGSAGQSNAAQVTTGVGINQVDFDWQSSPDDNSVDANLEVDPGTLGHSSGYLNVVTADGWVVQNMPILSGGGTQANLKLPVSDGTNETSVMADVDYSATPLTAAPGDPLISYAVGDEEFNGSGFGANSTGPVLAPVPGGVSFTNGGTTSALFQPAHPNVQTALNQCAPASVANNLQWIHDTYGYNFPSQQNPLQVDSQGEFGNQPTSMVSSLDTAMTRAGTTRTNGSTVNGTQIINGVLGYLISAQHAGFIVKHQGLGNTNVTVTQGGASMTSTAMGAAVTFQFILNELTKGDAVELGYVSAGGGHFIEVVGAGYILGAPYILYKSDHDQPPPLSNDSIGTTVTIAGFNTGVDRIDFSYLDNNMNLLNEANTPQAVLVVTEAVPEPASMVLGLLGAALGLQLFRRKATK